MKRKGVRKTFVQRALPPLVEVVAVPAQTFGGELVTPEIVDADLLSFHGTEGTIAIGWREETVICEHRSLDVHFPIVPHQ